MATIIGQRTPARVSIAPDRLERFLGIGALVLLAAALAAVVKGRAQWALVPPLVWVHLGTILIALALTPVLLLGRRATRRHRVLGTIWVLAMLATAIVSFGVRGGGGHFSAIHILSLAVVVLAPWLWWTARTHRVAQHRRTVRGMVIGALLIAGFFTFPFDRLLGHWLFS